MGMQHRIAAVLVLTALLVLVATRPVDGEVPTATDFAACNEQAPQTIKAGAASPTTGDHRRADSARGGIDFTATVVASPDPQIHGMDAAGAKNPEYQAAYRSCMRRKGF